MQYLNKAKVAPVLGEFLGTVILVMVAIVLSETTAVSYFIATSVAATLAVAYLVFSGVSGAHLNPAVTFGLWTARRVRTIPAIAYIVAQLLGGWGAMLLYQYLAGHHLASRAVSGFDWKVLIAEAVGTLVLAIGFTAAASRTFTALESALTYGTSLFVGILVASVAAAAYLNPAVALGLHGFTWVYIVAPLIGGLVGVNLYAYLFSAGKAKTAKK